MQRIEVLRTRTIVVLVGAVLIGAPVALPAQIAHPITQMQARDLPRPSVNWLRRSAHGNPPPAIASDWSRAAVASTEDATAGSDTCRPHSRTLTGITVGAIAGAAIGFVIGRGVQDRPSNRGVPGAGIAPFQYGIIGLGVGALVGGIIGSRVHSGCR